MTDKRKLSSESLQAHLLYNPIADMEYRVLATGRSRTWQRFTYLFLAALGVLPFGLMMLYAAQVVAYPDVRRYGVPSHHTLTLVVLMILYLVNYLLTVIRTLYISADSFGRERRDRTLEMLLLTGVSARQIVLGKWVGVLRALVPNYFYLWVVRVLLIVWLYVEAIHSATRAGISGSVEILPQVIAQIPWAGVLLAAAIAAVSLMLEAMMAASLGMLWVTARSKNLRDRGVAVTHFLVSVAPIILLGLLLYALPGLIALITQTRYDGRPLIPEPTVLVTMLATLIDNTFVSTSYLISGSFRPDTLFSPQKVALGMLLGLALYPLITVQALRLAQHLSLNPVTVKLPVALKTRKSTRKPRREPEFQEAEVV